MARSQPRQGIPTKLSAAQFEQFVLPHLSKGHRGPATKLGWHTIFNYILRLLYLGCQWKELPIEKDRQDRPDNVPESCVAGCEACCEALTGADRPAIEPRNA